MSLKLSDLEVYSHHLHISLGPVHLSLRKGKKNVTHERSPLATPFFFNKIIQFSYPVFILSLISLFLPVFHFSNICLHPMDSQVCSSVVPLSLLGSCAGLLETGSSLGERRVSLGNLYSHSVRAGSGERNLWLKEDLSSIPFHFLHLHTHA